MILNPDELKRVSALQAYFREHHYAPDYFHGNTESERAEAFAMSDRLSEWYDADRERFLQAMRNLGYDPQESDTGGEIWWCWLQTPHGRLTAWMSSSALSDMAESVEDFRKASQSRFGMWWFTVRFRIGLWLESRRNKNKP